MRVVVSAFLGMAAMAAVSAQAAPISVLAEVELGGPPPVELAAQGCGHGWHRHHWRDHWGYWHWGHCVPSEGPHAGWGAGWAHPHANWRGPTGGWGNP